MPPKKTDEAYTLPSWAPLGEPTMRAPEEVPHFPTSWQYMVTLLGQLLGLFPLRHRYVHDSPEPRLRWRYSRALQALALVAIVNCVYSVRNFFFPSTNAVPVSPKHFIKRSLDSFSLLMFALSAMPCLCRGLFQGKQLERYVNSLLLLIAELRPAGQSVWPPGWALRALVLPGVLATFNGFREYFHLVQMPLTVSVICIVTSYAVPLAMEVQYIMTCSILGLGYSRLDEHVRALQGPPRAPSARWLDAVRRYHEELVALTTGLHGLLGPQLMVTMWACQLTLLSAVYNISSDWMSGARLPNAERIASTADLVYFFSRLAMVCAAASAVQQRVAGVQSQSLRVDPETWRPQSKAKWSIFLDQLDVVVPSYSASGLFRIGMEFLVGVCAVTLTYLLVLLQMDSGA